MHRSQETNEPIRADKLEKVRLTRRFVLWQRVRGHRSATDDILCAFAGHAAMPDAGAILDLGAGQGAVALMLVGVNPRATVTAVEAQAVSFRLLERNVAENDLSTRVRPIHADLREVDFGASRFDLITGSPPYVPLGRGVLPRDAQRAAARFELRGGIEDYCAAAGRWLAADGRAVFLMDAAQEQRSQAAVVQAGLAVEELLRVHPRQGARARFCVYRLAHRAVAAKLVERSLSIRDEGGQWTADFRAVRHALDLPGANA